MLHKRQINAWTGNVAVTKGKVKNTGKINFYFCRVKFLSFRCCLSSCSQTNFPISSQLNKLSPVEHNKKSFNFPPPTGKMAGQVLRLLVVFLLLGSAYGESFYSHFQFAQQQRTFLSSSPPQELAINKNLPFRDCMLQMSDSENCRRPKSRSRT